MKVKELIKVLETLDQEEDIMIMNSGYGEGINLENAEICFFNGSYTIEGARCKNTISARAKGKFNEEQWGKIIEENNYIVPDDLEIKI